MFTLFWALCWPILGLCWGYVGFYWVVLGLCWVLLGCLWPILGLCCPPGVALGLWSLYFKFMLDHLGTMLGFVGSSWAYVGPSWDYVRPSWVLCWAILAVCWPILGLCCAVLGLCRRKKRHQSAKVVWTHVSKPVCGFFDWFFVIYLWGHPTWTKCCSLKVPDQERLSCVFHGLICHENCRISHPVIDMDVGTTVRLPGLCFWVSIQNGGFTSRNGGYVSGIRYTHSNNDNNNDTDNDTSSWLIIISPMVVRLQNATPLVLQNAPSNHLLINEKHKTLF